MTDRELLAIVFDLEATEGYVDVQQIAESLWPRHARDEESADALHCRNCVTRRLAWLRHETGLVEKHDSEMRKWRLTRRGEEFLAARLRAQQTRAVLEADEDQLPELTALIGERYDHAGHELAWLTRREWQHRLTRRR